MRRSLMAGGWLAWGVRTAASGSSVPNWWSGGDWPCPPGLDLSPMPAGIHPLLESACRRLDMEREKRV